MGNPIPKIKEAKEEIAFRKHPAYEIANYFREAMKQHGRILDKKNWYKSREAAYRIIDELSYIPLDEWKACIEWALTDRMKENNFAARIHLYHLGYIITLYNHYVEWKQINAAKKRRYIDYGEH